MLTVTIVVLEYSQLYIKRLVSLVREFGSFENVLHGVGFHAILI